MRRSLMVATGLALSAGLVALSPVGPGGTVPTASADPAPGPPTGVVASASPIKQ